MNLQFSAQDLAFRNEVRRFLAEHLPENVRRNSREGRRPTREQIVDWQQVLNRRGWGVPRWPREWGGADWTPAQHSIFSDEMQLAPAPEQHAQSINLLGPVLATFGSEAQKQRFLPAIANLDLIFCQGYSEPGAGSDLASLATRAVRDGDHYVVNGQKIWTTSAHFSDWMFCLVRTDPAAKKHLGISFLLIDMKSPGITVKPIIMIDGYHDQNQIFFDEVRVPVENRIGEENRGWDVAKALLGHERMSMARVGLLKRMVQRIRELAVGVESNGGWLIDDGNFSRRLAALEVDAKAIEVTQWRVLAAANKGGDDRGGGDRRPDPFSSIMKLQSSEIRQRLSELLVEVAGPFAHPYSLAEVVGDGSGDWPPGADAATAVPNYLNMRNNSIAGGSSEIQRNIIAKVFLGL